MTNKEMKEWLDSMSNLFAGAKPVAVGPNRFAIMVDINTAETLVKGMQKISSLIPEYNYPKGDNA